MSVRFYFWIPLLVLLLLSAASARAQGTQISGTVRADATDAPLAEVNVTLERDGVVVAGTTTDAQGRYRLAGVAPGAYVLAARFVGYRTVEVEVMLGAQPVVRDLRMQAAVLDLQEVEVSALPEQDQADPSVSLRQMRPAQIRQLAGGAEDVMRALQTLPGVLSSNDFSNQLIVRGGTPDQNLIILDDIELFSPYQLSGMGSLLNASVTRSVELYAGAFPARYGDRLSSVLAVEMRDGRPDTWLGGQVSTNMISANLVLEGKTGFWQGSWLASGRRTYFDSFANTFAKRVGIFNDIAFPDFGDVQAKLTLRPARNHQLRFTGLYSRDVLDVLGRQDTFGRQGAEESLREGSNESINAALGGAWNYVPSSGLRVKILANWYRNTGANQLTGDLAPTDGGFDFRLTDALLEPPPPVFGGAERAQFDYDQAYRLEKAALRGQVVASRGRHTVELGGGVDFLTNELDLDLGLNAFGAVVFDALQTADPRLGALADSADQTRTHRRYQAYAQDRIALANDRIFVQPSLRYDYYGLIEKHHLSPRVSVSILLDDATTVRLAGGRYLQSPGFEKLLDPENPFNLARFISLDQLGVERAMHLGASLSRHFGARWRVKVEGYWKQLDDLISNASRQETRLVASYERQLDLENNRVGRLNGQGYVIREADAFALTPEPVNQGSGHAYGADLLIEKRAAEPSDVWQGWLAYSFARAFREQSDADTTVRFPFDYDRRHTLSVVISRRLGRYFKAGLTWRFGSGFPHTPPVSMDPLVGIVDDPETGETRSIVLTDPATGLVRLVPGYGGAANLNTARLPDYHRLDARLTFASRWRGTAFEVYLEVINVYNRKNVVRYHYVVEVIESPTGLPASLTPPPEPLLFKEPVYMFPFIPSFGFSVSF